MTSEQKREETSDYNALYRRNNPEKIKLLYKRWARKNRAHINAYKRRKHSENPDKNRKQLRSWCLNNQEKYLLKNARTRANRKGIPFSIRVEDVSIPELCPVLNIPLRKGYDGSRSDNSPSLDRTDSKLGYVSGNVRVISWRANHIKTDATLEELEKVVRYLRSFKEAA